MSSMIKMRVEDIISFCLFDGITRLDLCHGFPCSAFRHHLSFSQLQIHHFYLNWPWQHFPFLSLSLAWNAGGTLSFITSWFAVHVLSQSEPELRHCKSKSPLDSSEHQIELKTILFSFQVLKLPGDTDLPNRIMPSLSIDFLLPL